MAPMAPGPTLLQDVDACVDAILERVGRTVVLGLPLGLGKPTQLVNALYARACKDPSIRLRILTALSLEKPTAPSPLEKAFLDPFVKRVFGDCPDLDYVLDLRRNRLPANVEVCEFFFRPGSFLNNAYAQQNYISTNYTHAARDVFAQGCNVAAQIVARRETPEGTRYSLSCNPDTSPELVAMLRAAERRGERKIAVVAQVNQNLPYMYNDAEVGPEEFDLVVDNPRYYTQLFGTPKMAVATADFLVGLQASALIRDGGTLQVGIGALGDAVVYATELRHQQNDAYLRALRDCGIAARAGDLIREIGGTGSFEQGLYGATEMFVDGFLHLYKAGILRRRVYDFWALQQLLNEGRVQEDRLTSEVLEGMESLGVRVIRTQDFSVLQHHGLFRDDCRYELGHIIAPDGERIMANLAIPDSRQRIEQKCLGQKLRNGIVLHGGFFLGPNDFYQGLRDMSEEERRRICMTGVNKINQLDLNPRLYRLQRKDARFINSGIMCTLSGAVVSDGLADGRVVSGVGGQYNFVAMAHQLPCGRSILMIRAIREIDDGEASSNIVWNYGHCTIPRHLRDIVITEYGIAMLRGKTDSEIIKALLNVADSRFQPGLLETARRAGKIEADYRIPDAYLRNTPERLEADLAALRGTGLFPAFPFGTDFTREETILGKALRGVKARAGGRLPWRAILDSLKVRHIPAGAQPYLARLGLEHPEGFRDRLVQKLLVLELQENGDI